MVCLEDGITSCGFRKMAAYAARLNPDTRSYYVSTKHFRGVGNFLSGESGRKGELGDADIDELARGLAGADIVGFSSMTGYADLTRAVMKRLRVIDPSTFIVWGGIHPIIHPADAILADVDAICNGEGELAFHQFYDAFSEGRDYTRTANFWFRTPHNGHGGEIVRNGFLPLMTSEEMETLPFPQYGAPGEMIYVQGRGFVPATRDDYVMNFSLGYQTVWSIGCPFHCSFCGNTKFIANDASYKKLRHPSPQYVIDEVKAARARFPHISNVAFNDDSFMAITYRELEEFAELWKEQLALPFTVYGVIPNYVKKEKFDILTWAGMNRVRMGIQSGSQEILDFYKRPTPPARILEAGAVIASYAPDYHIPPAYDIIVDNPIETRENVVETLELLYRIDRPYTLFIYSLKVIPNTDLEQAMTERGVDLEGIDAGYLIVPPRAANLLLYVLAVWKPPRWLFDLLLRTVRASSEPQRMYPRLGVVLRAIYMTKRVLEHLRGMDFAVLPGRWGYWCWRLGLVRLGRRFVRRPPRPEKTRRRPSVVAARLPVMEVDG
jgi:anaerobic magnesium-protoporphyrin IX monomethyl ester cyclase